MTKGASEGMSDPSVLCWEPQFQQQQREEERSRGRSGPYGQDWVGRRHCYGSIGLRRQVSSSRFCPTTPPAAGAQEEKAGSQLSGRRAPMAGRPRM